MSSVTFDPQIARPSQDVGGRSIAILFVILLGVISIPVLTHNLPPLSDYVNHLARMHVIDAIDSDPYLVKFYAIQWQIIPNLIMDLIVPTLAHVMNIYLAGQLFLISIFIVTLSGALVLNRALSGRWSVLPLVVAPLLYNNILLIGLMNYLFGIGLVLWALAAWVRLRDQAWPWRIMVSAAFVVALFFCHLVAVGLYGLSLLAFELHRVWTMREQSLCVRLLDFCATGIPFLPVVPLLLLSPTMGLMPNLSWEPNGKIDGLFYIFSVYYDVVAFLLIGFAALALIWAVRRKAVRFHPMGWLLLGIGGVVYLLMPRVFFATYGADQRIPLGLAFVLLACLDLKLRHRVLRHRFVVMLIALVAVRVAEVQMAWDGLSPAVRSLGASVQEIERGASVLVAYADPRGGDDVRDLGLVHAACIAMIERSAMVTTAFTVPGKQILRVREEYNDRADTEDGTPPTVEQLLVAAEKPQIENANYWGHWTTQYDYVYVLFTKPDTENPDPVHLRLVFEGQRFQLYRTAQSTTTTAATAAINGQQKPHDAVKDEEGDGEQH